MRDQFVDPATRFVRSLPGEYYMLREAAGQLDLSHHTLRKYIADGTEGLQPSKVVMFGKVQMYLYTKSDIEKMKDALQHRALVRDYSGGGRPSKYTAEERKRRSRLFSRRHYWQRVVCKASFMEDTARVAEAQQEIDKINEELK